MTHTSDTAAAGTANTAVDRRVLEEVARALGGLRFGSVEITVHDGRVTQIESRRKLRLTY